MLSRLANLFKKGYQVLNLIEVSKNNLTHNFKYLSSFKMKVAPVVKSNGYGHGITNVAKILDRQNAPFFCVDSLYEAYQLLRAKIKTPILITGYTNPQNLAVKKLPFSYAVYIVDLLEVISKYQPNSGVHIFVDTGMRREGVTIEALPKFLETVKKYPNIQVSGIMSHLASTRGSDDLIFKSQIKNFKKALNIFKKYKIKPKWVHIAASGGLINSETRKIISQISNLCRAGLALYGLGNDPNLKPALKLITHIAQIKTLKRGKTTGYDGTFKAKKDLTIGILPMGYNDGIDRRLSNKGMVTVNGVNCPIIGRVSMNITTVDLSRMINPQVGQEVVVFSDNPADPNCMERAAQICKTIPYDILVGLATSTKRVVI